MFGKHVVLRRLLRACVQGRGGRTCLFENLIFIGLSMIMLLLKQDLNFEFQILVVFDIG